MYLYVDFLYTMSVCCAVCVCVRVYPRKHITRDTWNSVWPVVFCACEATELGHGSMFSNGWKTENHELDVGASEANWIQKLIQILHFYFLQESQDHPWKTLAESWFLQDSSNISASWGDKEPYPRPGRPFKRRWLPVYGLLTRGSRSLGMCGIEGSGNRFQGKSKGSPHVSWSNLEFPMFL
jgi:hypothetical protein